MKSNTQKAFLVFGSILALNLTLIEANDDKVPADNTEKNERDRSSDTKTSGDQSNSPEDLKITQAIRQAVVKDGALTVTAKNVKIIDSDFSPASALWPFQALVRLSPRARSWPH